ncbi:unnamed protein product [Prorocentrum cordatum]|uniref:Transcription initiation factor IIF subunit alpha n=1 Tax=Prorocentrum cordatum TaxID=2364126 RepID=A0ABN9TTK3_9DINO|nr:unnamed protein product [Polarella glacialis]
MRLDKALKVIGVIRGRVIVGFKVEEVYHTSMRLIANGVTLDHIPKIDKGPWRTQEQKWGIRDCQYAEFPLPEQLPAEIRVVGTSRNGHPIEASYYIEEEEVPSAASWHEKYIRGPQMRKQKRVRQGEPRRLPSGMPSAWLEAAREQQKLQLPPGRAGAYVLPEPASHLLPAPGAALVALERRVWSAPSFQAWIGFQQKARRAAAPPGGAAPPAGARRAGAGAPPVHSYVRKAVLDSLRQKLKAGSRIDASEVASLTEVEGAPDEEVLVPVDLARLMDQDTETYRRTAADPAFKARGYVDAAELFASNPEGAPAADRPAPMSARGWREQALASDAEDSDEGGSEEGEEEEPGEGDEEEGDPAGDDDAESAGEAAEGGAGAAEGPAAAAAAPPGSGAQAPPSKRARRG